MPQITIGSNQYPAFEDVDGADAHLAADVSRAIAWEALDQDAKARGLISATRQLLALPWCEDAPDPEGTVPTVVAEVTAELAADLNANPELFADASGSSNVKSAGAGSAKVEFFAPVEGGPPLPRALWDRLVSADLVCLNSSSGMDVTLDGAQPFGTCAGVRPLTGRYPWDWPIAAEDYD